MLRLGEEEVPEPAGPRLVLERFEHRQRLPALVVRAGRRGERALGRVDVLVHEGEQAGAEFLGVRGERRDHGPGG